MEKRLSILDAFKALEDISDEEIDTSKMLKESRAFNVRSATEMQEAEEFIDNGAKKEVTLEVIDVDADTLEHVKDNKEYVGQIILQCKTCKTPRFIDAEDLVVSENDPEVYNVDAECPHCHSTGSGYTIIGQVGQAEETAEEASVENDSLTDEATLDNDLEEVPETAAAEEPAEEPLEEPLEGTVEEEPDAMETVEDDTADMESTLGDEFDSDDVAYDDTEEPVETTEEETTEEEEEEESSDDELKAIKDEEEKDKKESLTEAVDIEPNTVEEFLSKFIEPETLENVVIFDLDSDDPEAEVFKGSYEELPRSFLDSSVVGFNSANGKLVINVDTNVEQYVEGTETLADALRVFNNDFADNLIIFDQAADEEIYEGTKQTALEELGDVIFLSFEQPDRLEISCRDVKVAEGLKTKFVETLDLSYPEDRLISDIFLECGLSEYKIDRYGSDEYWIADAIRNKEDLEFIFNNYIFNKSDELIAEFKDVTQYGLEPEEDEEEVVVKDSRDEAIEEAKEVLKQAQAFAVIYGYQKGGKFFRISPVIICATSEQLKDKTEIVKLRYKPTGSIAVMYKASVEESIDFTSRKELRQAIIECQNNNQPYSIKSLGNSKYRLIKESPEPDDVKGLTIVDEDVDEEEAIVVEEPVRLTIEDLPEDIKDLASAEVLEKGLRISYDLADAIKSIYGLESDVIAILADMFSDEELQEHPEVLDGEEFSTEALLEKVASDEFGEAIKAAKVPGVIYLETEGEESGEVVELPEEPVEEITLELDKVEEEPEEVVEEAVEEKEFDEKLFENVINRYLDDNFEETYLFETKSGNFTTDGRIILEGVLNMEEEKEINVKFVLTPETSLNENLENAVKFENYVVNVDEALKEIK